MLRGPLKRWLLANAQEWKTIWTFRTPKGQAYESTPDQLILLFLRKVILECEKTLRKTVNRIVLSYPANFSPRARKRFDEILARLESHRLETHPVLKEDLRRRKAARSGSDHEICLVERVSTLDSSPDEASAVAIGFVHDQERFRMETKELLGDDRIFLVASFDFGGGSINSRLLEFEIIGTSQVLKVQE